MGTQAVARMARSRVRKESFIVVLFHWGDVLEGFAEEVVELRYAVDVDILGGGVRVAYCGAEGDHVPVGVCLAHYAALEAGVYGCHGGFGAVEIFEGGLDCGESLAVDVGFPTWVFAGSLDFGSGEAEDAVDGGGDIVAFGLHGAADEEVDGYGVVVGLDDGHIGGGFDKTGEVGVHLNDTVGGALEGVDKVVGGLLVDDGGGEFDFLSCEG